MTVELVIAPLSNDPLRDWPIGHYRALASLCAERLDATITLVGTAAQRAAADAVLAGLDPARARNRCSLLFRKLGAAGGDREGLRSRRTVRAGI